MNLPRTVKVRGFLFDQRADLQMLKSMYQSVRAEQMISP